MENKNNTEQQLNNINQSVGAPHIRQRLYFVAESLSGKEYASAEGRFHAESGSSGTVGELAHATIKRHDGRRSGETSRGTGEPERSRNAGILEHSASDGRDARRAESDRWSIASGCGTDILGDAAGERRQLVANVNGGIGAGNEPPEQWDEPSATISLSLMGDAESGIGRIPIREEQIDSVESGGAGAVIQFGDANDTRSQGWGLLAADRSGDSADQCAVRQAGPTNGFWRDAEWIYCRDNKYRAVEPLLEQILDGTAGDLGLVRVENYPNNPKQESRLIYAPLISKAKNRAMRLRGYGNAIVAPVAEAFIRAYLESEP